MSNYLFNTFDTEATWNLFFAPGLEAQLLNLPQKKENGLTINWAMENGTERYHGIKTYESKHYNILCYIIASTKAEFLTKYNSLSTFLLTTGEFDLKSVNLSRLWKVSYQNMSAPILYKQSTGQVVYRFLLQLVDDHPTQIYSA